MQPTDSFWSGVGESVASSPGWMVVGVVLVIGVMLIVAKHIVPSRERIKMRELDIREREAQNASAMAEQMRGVRESNDNLATQSAALAAGIEESRARSRVMGEATSHIADMTDRIADTTERTADKVDEIHSLLTGHPEVTD